MSVLIIGDIHIKAKKILPRIDNMLAQRSDIERVVFCGDYCDDWTVTDKEFKSDICYLCD